MKRREFLKYVSTMPIIGIVAQEVPANISDPTAFNPSLHEYLSPVYDRDNFAKQSLKDELLKLIGISSFVKLLEDVQIAANKWRFTKNCNGVSQQNCPDDVKMLWTKYAQIVGNVVCRNTYRLFADTYNARVDHYIDTEKCNNVAVSNYEQIEHGLYDRVGWEHLVDGMVKHQQQLVYQITSDCSSIYICPKTDKLVLAPPVTSMIMKPLAIVYHCNSVDTTLQLVLRYNTQRIV